MDVFWIIPWLNKNHDMHVYGDILQLSLHEPTHDIQLIMTNRKPFKNGNVQTCIDKVI